MRQEKPMRQKRFLKSSIYLSLPAIALALATLQSAGCATQPHVPVEVYLGYEGPRLPPEQVAIISTTSVVLTIDGVDVNTKEGICREKYPNKISHLEVMPGKHTLEVYARGSRAGPVMALIQATLQAGHTYAIRKEYHRARKSNNTIGVFYLFAVSLIDKSTGEIVGGRDKEALNLSWTDLENKFTLMAHEGKKPVDVMEIIGIPSDIFFRRTVCEELLPFYLVEYGNFQDPFPDNTLVYTACKSRPLSPFFVFTSQADHMSSGWSAFYEGCGYLFIQFNQSNEFQNYYYVDVPFNECLVDAWTWDTLGRSLKIQSCRYHNKLLAYIKYFIRSNNPDEAYHALESGIINAHKKIGEISKGYMIFMRKKTPADYPVKLKKYVDQEIDVIISEGRALIEQHPEMFTSAANSFSEATFVKAVTKNGDKAATIEHNRLAVYRRLVGEDRAEQAEREFSKFFGVTSPL